MANSSSLFEILIATIGDIRRSIGNGRSRRRLNKTLKRLAAHTAPAGEYASQLDCFIGRHDPVPSHSLAALVEQLHQHPRVGKYTIRGIYTVQPGTYLFVTLHSDQDIAWNHQGQNTLKAFVSQTNFVLRPNHAKERLEIYTKQYENHLQEKELKRFAKAVFEQLDVLISKTAE